MEELSSDIEAREEPSEMDIERGEREREIRKKVQKVLIWCV